MKKQTKLIKVTKNDIKNGKLGDCYFCPIALALKRTYPKTAISVDAEIVSVKGGAYLTNNYICDFICDFDSDVQDALKPFSFRLSDLQKRY